MKIFYGWYIVAVACICYGFGISPAYYSWGFYFPELQAELGFTKADLGLVFGLFTFIYSAVGPFVGILQRIIGIRACMAIGGAMAGIGFLIVGSADQKWHFLLGMSVLGGCGIGMSTIIPCQTLGQNWFRKRLGLVIAIILCSGGVVGFGITTFDAWVIENFQNTWRTGWQIIACISFTTALLAGICIRDTPEKMGLQRDGAAKKKDDSDETTDSAEEVSWAPIRAIMTKQFFLMTIAGVAYAVPWGVVVAHGRTHLSEQGLETNAIAIIMGSLALISIIGRLSGILGDKINPRYVIIVGLILEGLGAIGFFFSSSFAFTFVCLFFIGIGFGATYVCIPIIFSDFFGRAAFGTTAGTRVLITGVFNGLAPWITGMIADATGSYLIPFMSLGVLCGCGAFAVSLCRHPGPPPSIEEANAEAIAA